MKPSTRERRSYIMKHMERTHRPRIAPQATSKTTTIKNGTKTWTHGAGTEEFLDLSEMAKRVGCDKASILRTAQEFLQHQTPLQVTLLAPADSVGSAVTFTVTAYTSQRLDHAIRAARSLSGLSTASDATYTVRALSPDHEGNSGHVGWKFPISGDFQEMAGANF
jgi:hypothetical protein